MLVSMPTLVHPNATFSLTLNCQKTFAAINFIR